MHVRPWRYNNGESSSGFPCSGSLHCSVQCEQICLHCNFIAGTPSSADVILISTHSSRKALDTYRVHPEHVKVGEFVKDVVADRLAVDFEI